jgi:hypothetical protein
MTRGRLYVLAGLTGIAAMMAGDASAQVCTGWLKWACPDSASSNAAAREGVRRDKQLSRAAATSSSATGRRTKQAGPAAAATATPQQTQAPEPARSAKATRHTRSGDPPGDRRLARYEARTGTRLDPAMNDQEKEALFQQFLEWEKARRLNAETTR